MAALSFKRGLVFTIKTLAFTALLAAMGWVLLMLRLSQGPMNADFLTRRAEHSFHKLQPGFNFTVGSTIMTWGGKGQPFIFEMNGVQVTRADNTPVISISKIGVQLSKRRLLFGRVVPRVIRIYSPALRVVRGEDGAFTLNVSEGGEAAAPSTPEAAEPKAVTQTALLQSLLEQMSREDTTLLGGLEEISASNAAVLYEDKILGVNWRSRKSSVTFARTGAGIVLDSVVNIEQDATHDAAVRGTFTYGWRTRKTKGSLQFSQFSPALFAQQSEKLKSLAGVDMVLQGSLALNLDEKFMPGFGRFELSSDGGTVAVPGLFPAPLPVQKFYTRGQFNAETAELGLEQFQANIGGPRVVAQAKVVKQPEGRLITLDATLADMPIDKLKTYWPESLAVDARNWVTNHLSAGIAHQAHLNMALLSAPGCAPGAPCKPWNDFGPVTVQKLGGDINFTGIKVDYFSPLLPVTKVAGKATFDPKSFTLDLAGGVLGDMRVGASKVLITDLDIANDTIHSKIDITTSAHGPLQTALKLLDSKPLQYPTKLGMKAADAGGQADIDLNFKFPLYEKLQLEELAVTAKAKIDNAKLSGLVAGLPLTGGPMDVALKDSVLTVKGKGALGAMPVTFDWLKNFAAKAVVQEKLDASLPLDEAGLKAFGAPADMAVTGTIPATVSYTMDAQGKGALAFKGDLAQAGFTLPVVNYAKPAGTPAAPSPGSVGFTARFAGGVLSRLENIALVTDKADIRGTAEFAADGKTVKAAAFDKAKLGDTDVSLAVSGNATQGYDVKISGAQLDASGLFKDDDKPHNDAEALERTAPLSVSMNVGSLITGKNKSIGSLRLFLRRNAAARIDQLEVNGVSGGKPLTVRYMPLPQGGHTLNFTAENAGAALSALGITNGVRGGRVVVTGQPGNNDRDLRGTAVLSNFTLVGVPVLGRLLNALSLSGVIELLNGRGIGFTKARTNFTWTDRGPPGSAKVVRVITLKEGQTAGASLGLTFEGNIDQWRNTMDLNGTIIPVSDVNKVVAAIPVVGNILTGGGKGVFAATYKIKGSKSDPDVRVNPLSVLAPGILRKLFFEQ